MTDIKKELAEAISEALDKEIDEALAAASAEPHEFSTGFEKRMNELFNGSAAKRRSRIKRIVLIAVAAVLTLTAAACAFPKIRHSIAGFFTKVFEDHIDYIEPDITKDHIEEEYGLVPIPEGFEISDTVKAKTSLIVTYTDKENNALMLRQIADKSYQLNVDNEHGSFSEYDLNGKSVMISLAEDGAVAAWVQDGYFFSLVYQSEIDMETFESWIMSVQKE